MNLPPHLGERDETTFRVLTEEQNKCLIPLKIEDIENEYPELLEAKSNRSKIEYYFTLSPVLPLYLIEAALLRSSQGTTKSIAIAAPMTISPPSLSGIALSMA